MFFFNRTMLQKESRKNMNDANMTQHKKEIRKRRKNKRRPKRNKKKKRKFKRKVNIVKEIGKAFHFNNIPSPRIFIYI